MAMLTDNPELFSLPVIDKEQRVIGVLRSLDILKWSGERFFHEIFGRRSCSHIMDTRPLIVDSATPLRQLSEVVANLSDRHLVDGFIVTEHGRYVGSGRMTDLLKAVSDMQMLSARYANPLTQLPGNVPIDEHINRLLDEHADFVVAYVDLDNFKPYNDVYGYHAGDDILLLCGRLLAEWIHPARDFLGHIGGDDFVIVFRSDDWEARLVALLRAFDGEIIEHYRPEHRRAGGITTLSRLGLETFYPPIGMSIGVVPVAGRSYASAAALSVELAEAKKLAKQTAGSSYFVDRRRAPQAGTLSS